MNFRKIRAGQVSKNIKHILHMYTYNTKLLLNIRNIRLRKIQQIIKSDIKHLFLKNFSKRIVWNFRKFVSTGCSKITYVHVN